MGRGGFGQFIQGLAGNFNEQSLNDLNKAYGKYLLEGETITSGYTLIRDAVIFTTIRIIFVDKQGATGKKTRLKSIFLMTIVNVEMETAGAMLDDSEINITYLENIKLQAHSETFGTLTLEFPKSMDILPLYQSLLQLAYDNRLAINDK